MSYLYRLFNFFSETVFLCAKTEYIEKYPYILKFYRNFFFAYAIFMVFFEKTINVARVHYRTANKTTSGYFLCGFFYLWRHLRYWFAPIVLGLLVLYFSMCVRAMPFLKVVFEYFLVCNVFYWLVSGFVFFIKKYRYNRFTSAIQRFWRRSFILFWLIESSLFIVFIYLLFNASQEPVYTFDMIQLCKQRVYSWKFFLYKSFFVYLIILFGYMLLSSNKWNTFNKCASLLLIVTIILTYVVWLEFYQFFYTINWYGEIVWLFDVEDKTWYAESVFKRARIVNHYITVCIIAKFWHIVFIYLFWIFFILRSVESRKISYNLLSANIQNFLILYIMNWLLMYPWLKFIFRKFLTLNHKSLYEFRRATVTNLYSDFCLVYRELCALPMQFKGFSKNFYYPACVNLGFQSYVKDFVKPQLAEILLLISIFVFMI